MMKEMPSKAGEGNHHYYFPKFPNSNPADTAPFKVSEHYVGVYAVKWYTNMEGNFFKQRMASGTCALTLSTESYEVSLGTYDLKDGSHLAPFFNQPILANRMFRGGLLTVKVFARAIEKDTVLGGLLIDVAKASLGVVSVAVAAASATGPQAVLLAAGQSLTTGVKNMLNQKSEGVTILNDSGVSVTLDPTKQLKGSENYLLIHRGAELDENKLEVRKDEKGNLEMMYGDAPLDDGAWILFLLRREDKYGNTRPWDEEAEKAQTDVDNLMRKWLANGITKEQVEGNLRPRGADPPNVADQVLKVIVKITEDYVLARREANSKAGKLMASLKLAQAAAQQDNPQKYFTEMEDTESKLSKGLEPPKPAAMAIRQVVEEIAVTRQETFVGPPPKLEGDVLWQRLQYVKD